MFELQLYARPLLIAPVWMRSQSRSTAILGDEEPTDQVAPLPAHLLHNATRSESGHEFLGALNRNGGLPGSLPLSVSPYKPWIASTWREVRGAHAHEDAHPVCRRV